MKLLLDEAAARLAHIPNLLIRRDAELRDYTRFGLGGPADWLIDAPDEDSLLGAMQALAGTAPTVIGGGSNLVVADAGYRGVVLRYTGGRIEVRGTSIFAAAGALLQDLVDTSIGAGLAGIHTMTGIPGWVGGAIYGNAGAYGRSVHESISNVRFFDGTRIREFSNAECEFRYRESVFKRRKDWIILSGEFSLTPADADGLRKQADEILGIRNAKYPPTMKCAGSIFKNLILAELPQHVRDKVPARVVREGKVPSAYFLEVVGGKGMRSGDIHVADYHANLIYNAGEGTATDVRNIITELKHRVRDRFAFEVEEEVQYIGF